MIYEIINKGKGIISEISPSNLLLIKEDSGSELPSEALTPTLTEVLEAGNLVSVDYGKGGIYNMSIGASALNFDGGGKFGYYSSDALTISDSNGRQGTLDAGNLHLKTNSLGGRVLLRASLATNDREIQLPDASGILIIDAPMDDMSYVRNQGAWIAASNGGSGWGLTGNNGIDATNNFIGTNDNNNVNFRRNNVKIGSLQASNVYFGTLAGGGYGDNNIALGANALMENAWVNNTIAIGSSALRRVTGGNSIAIGSGALQGTTASATNIALGTNAGNEITTGNNNLFLGHNSGRLLENGSNNVFVGNSSSPFLRGSSGNVVLGNLNDLNAPDRTNTIYIANGIGEVRIMSNTSGKVSIINNLNVGLTSVYSDNSAAIAGGLVSGDVYRTSTGVLMIAF